MKKNLLSMAVVSALTVTGLAACGGGGGGAGTGASVFGSIAGFGSIIMSNGNEYETGNIARCEVDDALAPGTCEDSLSVGMHVKLQVDASGSVVSVEYDDELEGPAANTAGSAGNYSFTIFGADVVTEDPGTRWEGFSTTPPALAELDGANIEVSGEWRNNTLYATYVEMQGDTTHEAEGVVGAVNGTLFELTLQNGTVIDVDASAANLVPQDGDYVEIEGTYDGTDFFALSVEFEDRDHFDEDGEAEITGTLLADAGSPTGYSIAGTNVDIASSPTCNGLEGTVVEAEGSYDLLTAVLMVSECEAEDDDLEMRCEVVNVTVPDPARPKVGSLECTFPGTSGGPLTIEFRDAPDLAMFSDDSWSSAFDLTSVNSMDCVEIEASADAAGDYVAGLLELESSSGGCDETELEGPVDSFTDMANIMLLGVTYSVDGSTAYPDGLPVQGDYVKVDDSNADGIADLIEIDD